tara:strand:+ start:266 stop:496 length:231 start_codon:yes stop_codon:yes gene_type:complete
MSDFKEMLFSETIKPLNWQDLQARDEELQKEIDDQLERDEMDEVKQEQIKQDNREMYHAHLYDEMKENGMSLEDFI